MSYSGVEVAIVVVEIERVESWIEVEFLFYTTGDHRSAEEDEIGSDASRCDEKINGASESESGKEIDGHSQFQAIETVRRKEVLHVSCRSAVQ